MLSSLSFLFLTLSRSCCFVVVECSTCDAVLSHTAQYRLSANMGILEILWWKFSWSRVLLCQFLSPYFGDKQFLKNPESRFFLNPPSLVYLRCISSFPARIFHLIEAKKKPQNRMLWINGCKVEKHTRDLLKVAYVSP